MKSTSGQAAKKPPKSAFGSSRPNPSRFNANISSLDKLALIWETHPALLSNDKLIHDIQLEIRNKKDYLMQIVWGALFD